MKSRFIVALALAAVVSAPAFADAYGKHPAALDTAQHAMGDVRYRNLQRE